MKRALLLCVAVSCSVSSELKPIAEPSPEKFFRVSNMLSARCGSLDCHGESGRNLRLYGKFGLRWADDGVPGDGPTTQEEHDANYASVLALEPETLNEVARDGGSDPERLTLVRKGLELEAHKGGQALNAEAKRCFVSWLEGEVDEKVCFSAAVLPKPPGFDVSTGGSGGTGGGPAGGGGTGGVGGTGGTSASGGTSPTGGSAGVASGGTGGAVGGSGGGGGVTCAPGDFWPCTYDAQCVPPKPSPPDHDLYANVECLSCHSTQGSATPFLFAGTVWYWGATKGADHIEVGLRDGAKFLYTCTDARGFFSVPEAGNTPPNWLTVENRVRAELGEKLMPSDKEHKATCNDTKCHGDPKHRIWAP